ncbi:MAG: UvrD-helicase domain-containing protein [Verrucomicrobiae bacterium]|nr:UvrD-helicase domain-containing protein [Verrucomicrobiae bacterium]
MEPAPAQTDQLTPSQRQAVAARGNVLVMAGAGTGKTKTLVERCLNCLARDRVSLDELLVVTFTEAAAAEMRQRLRRELEKKSATDPDADHWARQLVLFDLAHIGTLHSFCLKLIREHFYDLGLDPQLAILDEGEARQRAGETLDEQFSAHYEGADDFSLAVQNLIQVHGGGRDENIRKLILRLHHYSQTRPDAAGWLARQRAHFASPEPGEWRHWLLDAVAAWRNEWLPVLESLKSGNEKAAELADILAGLKQIGTRDSAGEILEQLVSADGNWPARRKTILRKPLEHFFQEAGFLVSLAAVKNGRDPLVEDWTWVRAHMETLLRLAQEFSARFADRKRADGVVDFHDLEQFALKLLWDFSADTPTAVAGGWRKKLRFVFVDEYQDINTAQDKIIAALSGDGPEANRFLVGDVKQSIYRFRLADPGIFRDYARNWHGESGNTIPLSENFRSQEGLLQFVNSVCRLVMREAVGGVGYDAAAELKSGLPQSPAGSAPRAELLIRLKPGRNESREEEDGDLADLDEAQKEARLVARRLQQLITDQHEIWDDHAKVFRPAEWRDIAILLRSPRGKSEIFAKEFERAGIPLAVARGGFYESAEILDLLSLLQLLDNPLQDVPCIAVLRSPLVGLSLDELAEIRLGLKDGHFWTALARSQDPAVRQATPAAQKISEFLERFSRWRKLAKQSSLSECLEAVLTETLYLDWLRARLRGTQRAANVTGFLSLAQQFDQFQRQGLFRFLKFIEARQEAAVEPEISGGIVENAVRLMSIHQSKGLEFPVVVLADLAKSFNEQDLRGEIIFDEAFGLCPKVKPPASGRRYPSLPHWLARRRQQRELRGEEIRLLYVALTRARDNLILTVSLTEKTWTTVWNEPQPVTTPQIAGAKSFADWLALWFRNQPLQTPPPAEGEFEHLRWRLVGDETLVEQTAVAGPAMEAAANAPDLRASEKLRNMLAWNYPFQAATERKAKSSVTQLRREAEELADEAEPLLPAKPFNPPAPKRKPAAGDRRLSASEIGAAHHKFLQHVRLEKTDALAAESERLEREGYLTADECAVLDLDALAAFWNDDLGQQIRSNLKEVRRELPFTARFSPDELEKITGRKAEPGLGDEFIVVQGVADLVVLLPKEIWVVDFKTDELGQRDLPEKIKIYAPQLKLYAAALEKTFNKEVKYRALHFLALGRTEQV